MNTTSENGIEGLRAEKARIENERAAQETERQEREKAEAAQSFRNGEEHGRRWGLETDWPHVAAVDVPVGAWFLGTVWSDDFRAAPKPFRKFDGKLVHVCGVFRSEAQASISLLASAMLPEDHDCRIACGTLAMWVVGRRVKRSAFVELRDWKFQDSAAMVLSRQVDALFSAPAESSVESRINEGLVGKGWTSSAAREQWEKFRCEAKRTKEALGFGWYARSP